MLKLQTRSIRRIAVLAAVFAIGLPAHAQSWVVPKPSPGLMPNPTLGKKLFETNCSSCHGVDLRGTKQGPPFLHPYYKTSHHRDVAFQLAAMNGVRAHHWQFGDMKPVPGLTPDDVAHVTSYVRYQQRQAGIE
ncbi:MAG: cytochrome c [Rhodocyclaceae bacterium]|nr:cytochrome c [Rhodocyclaceae bacterium]